MLPSPFYHTIYLIVELFRINFPLIMFEDYIISIGPFIDTPSTTSQISNILDTHSILKQDQCFVEHYEFWCLLLTPTFKKILTPSYATMVLKLLLLTFIEEKN